MSGVDFSEEYRRFLVRSSSREISTDGRTERNRHQGFVDLKPHATFKDFKLAVLKKYGKSGEFVGLTYRTDTIFHYLNDQLVFKKYPNPEHEMALYFREMLREGDRKDIYCSIESLSVELPLGYGALS